MQWTGRLVSGLAALFLLFDCAMKVLKMAPAVDTTVRLGYPEQVIVALGIIELGCVIIYLIPRTDVLGAVLLTGYLGGAVATHVRAGSPLAGYILFPVYVGVFVWGGLLLRDGRLRALLPIRR